MNSGQIKMIKWQKNSIQYTVNNKNQQIIRVSPDSHVMKAKYEHFNYIISQLVSAGINPKDLQGKSVPTICTLIKQEIYKPQSNMPQPMGGFKNLEYNCKIDKSFSHK